MKLTSRKFLITIFIIFVFLGTGVFLLFNLKKEKPMASEVLPPVSIHIPAINVDAQIESVAQDKQGRMDVPKDVMNTAWYSLGAKPGEIGNAVIAGHLDTTIGRPAIFYKLGDLKKGDTIEVVDAGGIIYTYNVTNVVSYPVEEFPIEKVFGASDMARLNLITCDGEYRASSEGYSERVVVFSDLVSVQPKNSE